MFLCGRLYGNMSFGEGDYVERAAIRIYWYASIAAVFEASLLFILGLDLHAEQVKTLFLFGFPAPIIMYLCDRWLITRHVRPIDAVCAAQRAGQERGRRLREEGRRTMGDPQPERRGWCRQGG